MGQANVNRNSKPYAIVVGLDHINGIQTAHILARRHIPVIGIGKDPGHFCCWTRVCKQIIFTDTTDEPLIKTLEELGASLDRKAVLFPCRDPHVLLLSRNRRRLEPYYHLVLPDPEVVEMMMDKFRFYIFAREKGFQIPRTFFLHNNGDAENAASVLTFPCILKPPISSIPEWTSRNTKKAYLLQNAEEFLQVYREVAAFSDVLIAQEWIVGPAKNLYSCNCYFNAESEPVVTFVARKLRQWPPETGESSLGEECRNDEVLYETIRLFKSVDYRGLGYVEMKRDERTGVHYIIEPNVGRPTGRSSIAEAGGVELVYTMYCDALGLPLPENREQRYGNAKWIYLIRDLRSAFYDWRRGALTLVEWIRSLHRCRTEAVFAWNDPSPFLGCLVAAVRVCFSSEKRNKKC